MDIIPNSSLKIENTRSGSVQSRSPAANAGDRAPASKHMPQNLDGFSGSVIRIGVARVPSRRLNPTGK